MLGNTLHKNLSYKNEIVVRTIYAFTCRVNDFSSIVTDRTVFKFGWGWFFGGGKLNIECLWWR